MKRRVFIIVDIESERGRLLPSDERIRAALAHSTAGEALAEATECNIGMRLLTKADIEKFLDSV